MSNYFYTSSLSISRKSSTYCFFFFFRISIILYWCKNYNQLRWWDDVDLILRWWLLCKTNSPSSCLFHTHFIKVHPPKGAAKAEPVWGLSNWFNLCFNYSELLSRNVLWCFELKVKVQLSKFKRKVSLCLALVLVPAQG